MIDIGDWVTNAVVKAYCSWIANKYGKKTWFKLSSGPSTNASQFFELTKTTGRNLKELMDKAFSYYSPDWCQEKFENPFPPINVIIGPKCRANLAKDLPLKETMTLEQLDKQASDLVTLLMGSLGLEGALEVTENDWPEDRVLREATHKKLMDRLPK